MRHRQSSLWRRNDYSLVIDSLPGNPSFPEYDFVLESTPDPSSEETPARPAPSVANLASVGSRGRGAVVICRRRAEIAVLPALALAALVASSSVFAQTWDGGGANDNWTTAANWNPNAVPTNNGTANIVMAGNVRPTPNVDVAWDILGLTFNNTAGTFTLGGSQLTIRGSGITNNSANLQTIDDNVVLNSGQTWNAASGDILVRGIVGGAVGATLTKTGPGLLTLTGTNTFAGGLSIPAGNGPVRIQNSNALGAPGGTNALQSGTALQLLGDIAAAEPFLLNGSGISNDGVFRNISGANTISGALTMFSTCTFGADAGSLTLSGAIGQNGGTYGVTKVGSGTVVLSNANTYGGTTTINVGRLTVTNGSGSGTGTGAVTVGATGALAGSGTASGAITLNGAVEPGVTVGTLNTGAESWNSGGAYVWETNQANGAKGANPGWDWVNITGALTINATAGSPFTIRITSLNLAGSPGQATNFNPAQSYTWTIATASGGVSGFAANKFTIDASAFQNVTNGGAFSITQAGSSLNLVFTPASIAGTVFEDVNYGGGAGRDRATSAGVGRSGARVELYNNAGVFVTSTTTDASGVFGFLGLAAGSYTVRVANSTVTSSRTGSVAGLLPVQTYRTNASSGSAVPVTDYVGGQNPSVADAGNGAAGCTMNTTTGAFTGGGCSGTAQSITNVAVGASTVAGVDFGFNFDTIVNTSDAGQGSLRQFLLNSNALGGEAALAQSGSRTSLGAAEALPAGKETSVFMISDGQAHPGLRAGLTNQLTGDVAAIGVSTLMPALAGANAPHTILDGTTQTFNVGDTNAGTQGAGGTVGVDALTLNAIPKPEVQIADGAGLNVGLDVQASSITVRGVALYGFGSLPETAGHAGIDVRDTFSGTLIEENFIGSGATSFTAPADTSGRTSDPKAGTRASCGTTSSDSRSAPGSRAPRERPGGRFRETRSAPTRAEVVTSSETESTSPRRIPGASRSEAT